MISSLLCKFISPKVSVISLFANLRVFLVVLGNSSEFLSFFIEVSEEISRSFKENEVFAEGNKNLPELAGGKP